MVEIVNFSMLTNDYLPPSFLKDSLFEDILFRGIDSSKKNLAINCSHH